MDDAPPSLSASSPSAGEPPVPSPEALLAVAGWQSPPLYLRWSPAACARWRLRLRLRSLASPTPAVREAAIASFIAEGEQAFVPLFEALYSDMPSACGAALALGRMGNPHGLYTVLYRCYAEALVYRSLLEGYIEVLHAVRLFEPEMVGGALITNLEMASAAATPSPCLRALCSSLGALRVLDLLDGTPPRAWWEGALLFGRARLRGLEGVSARNAAYTLTDNVRLVGIRGLLYHYPAESFDLLREVLFDEDTSVGQTAIQGLLWLRDKRALVPLQQLAFSPGHLLAGTARRAIQTLAGEEAEALTLLRAANSGSAPDQLLRPAHALPSEVEDPASLLRSIENAR